jgi:hypothetical protein
VDKLEYLRPHSDDVGDFRVQQVEVTRVVDASGVTHLHYRVAP